MIRFSELDWGEERMAPMKPSAYTFAMHIKRYLFALDHIKGAHVLDAASGSGYGAYFMAQNGAGKVCGIDISGEAIRFAEDFYKDGNLEFRVMDLCALGFARCSFDTIISFVTIEHLQRPQRCLKEMARVLKVGGVAVISVPNGEGYGNVNNPFHLHKFSYESFTRLIGGYFRKYEIFYQYVPAYDEIRTLGSNGEMDSELPLRFRITRIARTVGLHRVFSRNVKLFLAAKVENILTRLSGRAAFNGTNFWNFIKSNASVLRMFEIKKIGINEMKVRKGALIAVARLPVKT